MNDRTRVAIAGGGPAGMFLGLLLARAGIGVTVLEKHADFLRDFRGDTVHSSTLTLLDELGLGPAFAAIPQRRITQVAAQLDSGTARIGDLSRLRGQHPHIALVPQWDLLELLADAAGREPGFELRRNAEVTGLLREGGTAGSTAGGSAASSSGTTAVGSVASSGDSTAVGSADGSAGSTPDGSAGTTASGSAGSTPDGSAGTTAGGPRTAHDGGSPGGGRVTGVVWRDRARGEGSGAEHTLEADLVVACDGRWSSVRAAAGLTPRTFGVPIDVWWFRVPRREDDPDGGFGRASRGQFLIMVDRGEYWQCGYIIRKGADAKLRAEGLAAFRARLAALEPWLADRLGDTPPSFDDVKLLEVRLDRLERWHLPGLLVIGDAAHAMSPVGGVGINLAIQDAVAAARIMEPALQRGGPVPESALQSVQRRRWWPTVLVQGFQQAAHRGVVGRILDEDAFAGPAAQSDGELPLPLRILERFPALQAVPARFIGVGPLPEHAPRWARR